MDLLVNSIRRTREILVSTPDTVCLERARLATEAYQLYADEPVPIRRAKTLRHILENMTLDLETNPIFAGNTSSRPRAWMLIPEHGFGVPDQAIIENPAFEGFLDNAIPDEMRAFWAGKSVGGGAGTGHLAVNLSRVLSEGLDGIIAEAESYPADEYRSAMVIACRAVISWAERYASEARRAAEEHPDPEVRSALLRVAAACGRVPAKPASDLFEALQAIALIHLAIHIEGHGYSVSLGLLDRVLLPYYDENEDATELLAAFMLKIAANSLWGSHSKTQAITIGGLDHRGNDACNPLTIRFLDACEMIRMPDPHVFVRWHEKMDSRVKERAIELLGAGLSMPLLIGDEQTAQGFIRAGVGPEDAWSYCVIGCNELGIPGKLWDSAVGPLLNDAAVLREAVMAAADGSDRSDGSDISEVLAAVRRVMKEHITRGLTNAMRGRGWAAEHVPTPFTSALMDGCIARGRDLHAEMEYSFPALIERGFTNAVNGLAAVERVVFEDGAATLPELVEALNGDFGSEPGGMGPMGRMGPMGAIPEEARIRQLLLNAPKWGNDDDRADKWALAWTQMRNELLREVEAELGDRRHVSQHVVRSLHHIDGAKLGATPDGRKAGAPLADSIGAQAGTALQGPTALLNSVIKLRPSEFWQGGYNLNLTISALSASDPHLNPNLLAMAEAFFAEGGQELQIGCLDADTLRDAKEHPEKYPGLLVRIAGFNALFTKLSPTEQDELIARAGNG